MSAAFGESVHGFRDFLASERRASRHTVSAYRRDLAQLTAFMVEKRGSELPAHEIDVFLLRQWLGAMARVVAPPSVARKISAIKAFFRYLHHRGLIENIQLRIPRAPRCVARSPRSSASTQRAR